jgi:hypothetical protein
MAVLHGHSLTSPDGFFQPEAHEMCCDSEVILNSDSDRCNYRDSQDTYMLDNNSGQNTTNLYTRDTHNSAIQCLYTVTSQGGQEPPKEDKNLPRRTRTSQGGQEPPKEDKNLPRRTTTCQGGQEQCSNALPLDK